MGGVIGSAGPLGRGGEPGEEVTGRTRATGRGSHQSEVVLPVRARRPGEHGRGDCRQGGKGLRRQGGRPEDQIGLGGGDRRQIGGAARAHRRSVVNHGAQVRRLALRPVRQRGADDPGLQAQRAQCVELVTGQHHDPHGVANHGRLADGMANRAGRIRVEARRPGGARLVGSTLISQHAGGGDLGGAGDHVPRRRTGGRRSRGTCATARGQRRRRSRGKAGS